MPPSLSKHLENWRNILQIAWPLIIANSFWNLQLTIDRIYLGHYSTESLGAAMAVMGVFWTPMALLQQTAAYLTTFVAQYYGAGEKANIGPAFWQSVYVSIAGGLLMLLFIPLSGWIFSAFGHPESVKKLEIDYFNAICFSALPTALVATASGYFTGLGKTQIIIWINGIGFLGNALFDYLFIFGRGGFPAMGIAGAGYATALSNCLAAAFGLYLVFKKEPHFFAEWRYNAALMWRYLRYGFPSGLQWALEGLAFTVFLILVGRMNNGNAGLAASSIVVTIMMLSILPALGVAQAVAVLVGQHLGEKRPELAEEAAWSGWQVSLIYIATVGATFLLFPQFYLSWFYNPADAELWSQVQTMVPYLLMYVAVFTLFDCTNFIFSFSLKGAGDTRFVSLIALCAPWPIMVIPTWLMRDWEGALYWAWEQPACLA